MIAVLICAVIGALVALAIWSNWEEEDRDEQR